VLAAWAAAAAGAGLVAAWATASTRAPHASPSVFRNGFVTFTYPTSWSATVWKEDVLHFDPMVYVGTGRRQHDPCRTSATAAGTATRCGWPVGALAPNGVLVKWENRGFPGARIAGFPGTTLSVGGRIARLSVKRPGVCRSLGADETISVAIARPLPDNWTQVDACLRGPQLAPLERQFRALLGSTRFLAP